MFRYIYIIVYKYYWVFKVFLKIWVSLLNFFLLFFYFCYYEIFWKEEIYLYIIIIIWVLGNLIYKCILIILRLFGILDSVILNRWYYWKKFIIFWYYWINCKKLKVILKDFLFFYCCLYFGNLWWFRRFNFIL